MVIKVTAVLTLVVYFWVVAFAWRAVIVFALEAFVRSPGVNLRAVHTEVFVAGELGPFGGVFDPSKKTRAKSLLNVARAWR